MNGTADTAILARVEGRVQGVAFRAWTQQRARTLGLDGWVRNEPDGTVSAYLSGDADSVADMVKSLHKGPLLARVTRVTTERAGPDDARPGFHITG